LILPSALLTASTSAFTLPAMAWGSAATPMATPLSTLLTVSVSPGMRPMKVFVGEEIFSASTVVPRVSSAFAPFEVVVNPVPAVAVKAASAPDSSAVSCSAYWAGGPGETWTVLAVTLTALALIVLIAASRVPVPSTGMVVVVVPTVMSIELKPTGLSSPVHRSLLA
jgi:hypothetical protein